MKDEFVPLSCVICNLPVDLETDRCADENGGSVHELCYSTKVTMKKAPASSGPVQSKFDAFA